MITQAGLSRSMPCVTRGRIVSGSRTSPSTTVTPGFPTAASACRWRARPGHCPRRPPVRRSNCLCGLVRGRRGRHAGAQINELADTLTRYPGHRQAKKLLVFPEGHRSRGDESVQPLGQLPVSGEVVFAAQPVVVDARDTGHRRVEIGHEMMLVRCRAIVSHRTKTAIPGGRIRLPPQRTPRRSAAPRPVSGVRVSRCGRAGQRSRAAHRTAGRVDVFRDPTSRRGEHNVLGYAGTRLDLFIERHLVRLRRHEPEVVGTADIRVRHRPYDRVHRATGDREIGGLRSLKAGVVGQRALPVAKVCAWYGATRSGGRRHERGRGWCRRSGVG